MTEAEALLEGAEAALTRREIAEAEAALDAAERLGAPPDRCSAGRWMTAMLAGDLHKAWAESDAIRNRNGHDPHRYWNGDELAGKRVMVRCLHGFGDAVQMLRYAPLLRDIAAGVVIELPPRMAPLAGCLGLRDVMTWGDDAPAWDVQVEVMELPYIFRTHADELPITEGYVQVPGAELERAAACMGMRGQPRVGLVWAGGEWNLERSIPFPLLRPLLELTGIEFWNLQGGPASAEACGTAMRDATRTCGDGLLALAATMAHLDLVITVDTLAAHLAGAMGKPVWVLLQHTADWRWMTGRDDSPWYPAMRLFRQSREGDWAGIVERVCAELRARDW